MKIRWGVSRGYNIRNILLTLSRMELRSNLPGKAADAPPAGARLANEKGEQRGWGS